MSSSWPDTPWAWRVQHCPDGTVLHLRHGQVWVTVANSRVDPDQAREQVALATALGGVPVRGFLVLLAAAATLDPENYLGSQPNRDSLLFAVHALTLPDQARIDHARASLPSIERRGALNVALSFDPDEEVRVRVVPHLGRSAQDQQILARLVNDPARRVSDNAKIWAFEAGTNGASADLATLTEPAKRSVAAAPDVKHSALQALASDALTGVRTLVARHPRCPAEALDALSFDRAASVRSAAVTHPKATDAALARASTDQSVQVRRALARAARPLPRYVLAALSRDSDPQVAQVARARKG